MTSGFVARFFDLDLEAVQDRLRALGAACVAPRRLVRQVTLENDIVRSRGSWVTISSEGERNRLMLASRQEGNEIEVPVGDFGLTRRFMEQIGFAPSGHQESYREDWEIHGIAFRLSDWPGLPRSLEINAPQEDHARWAAQNLGLDLAHAMIGPDLPTGPPEPPRAPFQAASAGSQELAAFKSIDLGWSVQPGFDPGEYWVNWVVVLENPNPGHYCEFPTIQVTARDKNDYVVGTEDQTLSLLPPGGRLALAGSLDANDPPHTLEIVCKPADWRATAARPEHFPQFGYRGVRLNAGGDSCGVTGEILNPFPQYVEQVAVTALFRGPQGDLVGGETAYVDGLPPQSATPFSLEGRVASPAASLDLMAAPWGSGGDDPWEQILRRV